MTLDEAIKHLDTYSSTNGSGQTTQAQHEESKRVAIATMRKYQKIEEIIKSWKDGTIEEKDSVYAFHKIMDVVGDENDGRR